MQRTTAYVRRGVRGRSKENERGVALLTALLLLMLLTGLSLAMVMSTKSDLLVNGYYRNFRGSFYAADSGLNIVRQAMVNQVNADLGALGANYNPVTTPPLSASEDSNVQTALLGSYGNWQAVTGAGEGAYASNSWPEQFKVSLASFTLAYCNVEGGGGTCAAPTGNVTGYQYVYNYSVTAQGRSVGQTQAVSLTDIGYVTVNANVNASKTSFAAWGMFIDQYSPCSGGFLVPGNIYGPVFTNGSWTFGTTGQYVFAGSVGQVGGTAGYHFADGTCNLVNGSSDTESGTHNTIAPKFQNGFNLSQNKVPLPTDSFNQEQAVVDGMGTTAFSQSSPGNLKTASGTAYPTSGTPPNGVYLPYTGSVSGSTAQFTGGGILVQGNASVTLAAGSNGSEVYTIGQTNGSTTTTTTVTITPGSTVGTGTTQITQQIGSTATVFPAIAGVPVIKDPDTGAATGDASMLYVNGNISSLSGPSSGGAVQNNTDLTVTGAGNVTITGNITYATEPVTFSSTTNSQGQTIPADSLAANSSQSGVLGIFTAGGNINLNVPKSGQNLEIDASLASLSNGGSGGLVNTGNAINTLTIVGGRIQNTIQNINSTTRNVFFDQRFTPGGISPPWFPSTTVTGSGFNIPPATAQRLVWINNSTYL